MIILWNFCPQAKLNLAKAKFWPKSWIMQCCFWAYFKMDSLNSNWQIKAKDSQGQYLRTRVLHSDPRGLYFDTTWVESTWRGRHWRMQGHELSWDSRKSVLLIPHLLAQQLTSRINMKLESYGWSETTLRVKSVGKTVQWAFIQQRIY